MPNSLHPQLVPLTRANGRVTLAALLIIASGCTCAGAKLRGATGVIEVDPNPIVITDGVTGHTSDVVVKVLNRGSKNLHIQKTPEVIEKDTDNAVEYAVVGAFESNCDGTPRAEASRLDLESQGCATLDLRYRPQEDGNDDATLRFTTDSLETPVFDVPIKAGALTPAAQVCAFDGTTALGCSTPGVPFDVDFTSSPVAIGQTAVRNLKLISVGSRALTVSGMVLTGDADFVVDPTTYTGKLEPTAEAAFTATFSATVGGARKATLVFSSDDAKNPDLTVNLKASVDGPAICYCVGSDTEACRTTPRVDFGEVPVGGTGNKYLRLASCGTQPVIFDKVGVATGEPIFGATGTPAVGATFAITDAKIDIPLTFKPPDVNTYGGTFNIFTKNQQIVLSLRGDGVTSGCKLEAPSDTLDFGLVGIGQPSPRDVTLSNRGSATCNIAGASVPTSALGLKFDVTGQAINLLPAGKTTKVTVTYTPADGTGPDLADMSISYRDDVSGAPASTMIIHLKGAPTASPVCKLTARPAANAAFGATLNFGQVRVNSTKVLPVTFQNVGSSPCTISNARLQAGFGSTGTGPFKITGRPASPLSPGASTTVNVSFTPASDVDYGSPIPGFAGTSLLVDTSDKVTFTGAGCGIIPTAPGAAGCTAWGLAGSGVRSALQVLPPDLEFGLITLGCRSKERVVTLYNVGNATITIKSIKLDPAPPPDIFTVVLPALPFQLVAGGKQQITVRYRPPDTQDHNATLFIESDATNVNTANPYVSVTLHGKGTTDSHQTDTFTQAAQPKTDVLFVIDDSGSMGEEQGLLANNARLFTNRADQFHSDYHIAVVTTDMDDAAKSGKFQGSPKIVTPGTNAATQFAATVRGLGTNGSGTERGMAAMFQALSDPLINDPAQNGGFLRADAKLAVVHVGDEDDQSNGTVDFYEDFLKNIKGIYNASLVSYSVVVGDVPGGCTSNNGDAVACDRYVDLQTRIGGQFRSICAADWGKIADSLGLDLFAARAGFPLSRVAVPSSIVVHVNGTLAPTSAWTYDAAANTVIFNANALPGAGATVVIDYDAICS